MSSSNFEKYNPGRHGFTMESREGTRSGARALLFIGIAFAAIGLLVLVVTAMDGSVGGIVAGLVIALIGGLMIFASTKMRKAVAAFDQLLMDLPNNGFIAIGRVTNAHAVESSSGGGMHMNNNRHGGMHGRNNMHGPHGRNNMGRNNMNNRPAVETRTTGIRAQYTFTDDMGVQHRRRAKIDTSMTHIDRRFRQWKPEMVQRWKGAMEDMQHMRQHWADAQMARQMRGQQCMIAFNENGSVLLQVRNVDGGGQGRNSGSNFVN
ncbi:MAG: hypothetical protein FWE38_04150 [Firmicutes bacterium]|nr:hypothetical protein [Bacillota bacterium]